ncbi:hypothetical protein EQV77_01930 [Halobacillus fulvus]|nr:hypothetical protein EQV77_01930 [Halobacillus fulvus]
MRNVATGIVISMAAIASVYSYRYKLLNGVSSVPRLRKGIVQVMMNVPFIRKKLLSHLFQAPK